MTGRQSTIAVETRSGLDAWQPAEMPVAPRPQGLQWLSAVGPGIIALGVSIGSGEFLLGPAAFVAHGLSLFWVVGVAITLQAIFNTEVMRYTLATGEPVFTGFMRTRPSSTLWAWIYATLYFLQVGWPAWAGTAAAAIFFLFARRLAEAADASVIYYIGVATFLGCVVILTVGRRIERTLELLNWVLVVTILGGFLLLALLLVPARTWLAAAVGFGGFDLTRGTFDLLPTGADFFLLGALVAYSGSGGVVNVVLSNWARDRGYGMGERAGYIPAAASGERGHLAHTGFTFTADAESMDRWRGWWRIVSADQWGLFWAGALLGMLLPAVLYVSSLPRGTNIQGLGISAALASVIGSKAGAGAGAVIAFLGAWLLFKTQLDNLEGMVRAITDILWTGSRRVRGWRGGDVRAVYYTVMAILVVWGLIAMKLAQPIVLLQLGANVAGAVFVIAAPHLLYINTCLLPPHVRPPLWRRAALILMTLFYGFFVALSIRSVWVK
ncbi:MAG TPA: Nramp family divalent metal transporter [Vicinamibacterales bacterium]|nr:Nramp family divalent metal transporter [Vicinamibacterales bacterium]